MENMTWDRFVAMVNRELARQGFGEDIEIQSIEIFDPTESLIDIDLSTGKLIVEQV